MKLYIFVAALLVTMSGAICLAQENLPGASPQQRGAGPCRLCAEIALDVNRDMISLQPMNGYRIEAGLASWEEMRRGLPESEAARYDGCFQNLAGAYEFVLNAANAWSMASQTRVSVPIDSLLSLNSELRTSLMSARALLQRATACCRVPQNSSKPAE
jgi:hypothetical protein